MHFPSILSVAITSMMSVPAVYSAPLATRDNHINDGVILNYLLTLQHLESAFYEQGLKNFTKESFSEFPAFFPTLETLSLNEKVHVGILLGELEIARIPAVKPCEYNFPVTTPEEFVHVSGVLEGVGVAAYLGAAASIADNRTLTKAETILTTEARYSSVMRAVQNQNPVPVDIDVPLGFNEVFSLASQFIVSCPSDNPPLPFKAFPVLSLTRSFVNATIKTETKIQLAPSQKTDPQDLSVAFFTILGPKFVDTAFVNGPLDEFGYFEAVVPRGIVGGQSYAVLVKGRDDISDVTIVAGPAIIEIAD